MINKDDWIVWKSDYVTKEVFKEVQRRLEAAREENDSMSDIEYTSFLRGMIHAFKEVLNIDIEVEDAESSGVQDFN